MSGGRARRNLEMLRMAAPAVRGDALVNAGGVAGRGRKLRVDAIVTIGDRPWLRRRWVSLGKGSNAGVADLVERDVKPSDLRHRPIDAG